MENSHSLFAFFLRIFRFEETSSTGAIPESEPYMYQNTTCYFHPLSVKSKTFRF